MRKIVALTVVACLLAAVVAVAAMAAPSSGPVAHAAASVAVPKLRCRRLDVAEDIVRGKGLRVVERGGGTFGIVVKSNWFVGRQRPAAGTSVKRGTKVYLYASREC